MSKPTTEDSLETVTTRVRDAVDKGFGAIHPDSNLIAAWMGHDGSEQNLWAADVRALVDAADALLEFVQEAAGDGWVNTRGTARDLLSRVRSQPAPRGIG